MLEWIQICLTKLTKANIRPTQEGLRSPNTYGPKGLMEQKARCILQEGKFKQQDNNF